MAIFLFPQKVSGDGGGRPSSAFPKRTATVETPVMKYTVRGLIVEVPGPGSGRTGVAAGLERNYFSCKGACRKFHPYKWGPMKNYILDTTVLLYDAGAINAFGDNTVIIPMTVIEDIDEFKKDLSENGRNARQTSRLLDSLRRSGSLASGIKLGSGGSLKVVSDADMSLAKLPVGLNARSRDNILLAIALGVKAHAGSIPTILVTKDINLRIKADALGLKAEDYEADRVDIEELYSGQETIDAGPEVIERFQSGGGIPYEGLLPHQYVVIEDVSERSRFVLGRFDAEQGRIVRLVREEKEGAWRIKGRNREQIFALDALLNEKIELITLVGKAGTGKTLLAVAAALYKTVDENVFRRILVSRPTLPMGKDIGYLPGTVEEKLTPWMYPIADNVEYLMRGETRGRGHVRGFKELVDTGILIIEPLTYIRGRSIHSQYLIVDEAQNLTPHEIKTIITRVGDGTKIVLTGDPYQIDNPYIDSSSNGLTYVVEKFKKQDISAHITLTKGERSRLSELAANLL
jgi:PhoH-like ATPase